MEVPVEFHSEAKFYARENFYFLNWSIKFAKNHAHRNRYCTKIYNQLYFCLFDVFVETASSDWYITWHHPSRETKVGQIDSPFKWRWRHWVSALFNFRETHPRPFENIFVAYFVFSIPKPNRARKFNAQKFKNFEKTVWKNLETRKPRIYTFEKKKTFGKEKSKKEDFNPSSASDWI